MIKTGFIYVFYSIYVLIGNFIVGLEIFPGLFHRGSSDLEWYFFENGLALVIIVTTILAFFYVCYGLHLIRKEKKADSSNEPVVSIEDTKNLDTLLSLAKIWALIFTFITIPAFFFSPLFSLLLVLVQLIINFITYQKKIHPVINFILFVIVGKELLFMDIFDYDMYGSVPAMASGVILLLGHILFVCLWYFKFYKKSHKSVLQNQNYSESHHLIFLIKSKILFYTTLVPVGLAWLCVGVLYLFLA